MASPSVKNVKQPEDPTLKDLLDLLKKDIMLAINCHALATVKSFDSATQTVTATINYKRTIFKTRQDGTTYPELVDYPILIDCPAIVLTGGSFSLKMPIVAGDTCLILFNDRAIDNWFSSGQVGPLSSSRLHSFSDGIALVGLRSLANSISGYADNQVVLGDGTHDLKVGDGEASLNVGTTVIKAGTAKILLGNNLTTLNTLLQDLCTQLQALTVTGVTSGPGTSGPPANAAAIATIATEIGGLLE